MILRFGNRLRPFLWSKGTPLSEVKLGRENKEADFSKWGIIIAGNLYKKQ